VILHIDGDSFFASCAQAVYPHLRGKPVVTGSERGVVTAASTEAKKLGISRQTSMYEIKKYFPQCIIVESNYEIYELFSQKMFAILRRYSPDVEKYSVDEGFVDLSGVLKSRRREGDWAIGWGGGEEDERRRLGETIKNEIEKSLEISVSVGIGPNKSIAKLASNFQKPSGLTVVKPEEIENFLKQIPIEDVWGIGRATTKLLQNYRIKTAGDFAKKDEKFVRAVLTKPGIEIWHELNGEYIFTIDPTVKTSFQSISSTHTFTPPSSDKNFVYSQLVTNLECACQKARLYNLHTNKISFFLKGQDFSYKYGAIDLPEKTATPTVIMKKMHGIFNTLFQQGKLYRATGVILSNLSKMEDVQESLLEDQVQTGKSSAVFGAIDGLSRKYGERVVKTGSTMFLGKQKHVKGIGLPRFEVEV